MDLSLFPLVILAGLVCGFVNTLAGSGSLITLPLLIFLGLPANVANGTNRVAILFQNMVAVRSFHAQKLLDFKRGKWLLIPAIIGAVLGAQIAADLDERLMRLAIAVIMVIMLVVILINPKRWLNDTVSKQDGRIGFVEIAAMFGVGLYGGFIQAGVGIFLLAVLVLVSGYDLVRGNALKVLVVLGFTPLALVVFVMNDQVLWSVGLVMASGNMAGAWLGARAAAKGGAPFVRMVLIAVIIVSSLKLFFDVFAG